MAIERALQLKDVQVNKISQAEFDARVEMGAITPDMIEQQLYMDYAFTMEVQKNCEQLKPVAMSGSYNDLTDKPNFEPIVINNTLTSQSTTEALAAAQGKVLDDKITAANQRITEVQNSIPVLGTKKYLHRIRLSIVSQDRKTSAVLFCDFYSDRQDAYTSPAFTTMASHLESIPVTGRIQKIEGSTLTEPVPYQLSILNFNGGYAFIINGTIEIDTYTAYMDDWTINDNVVGYIFA